MLILPDTIREMRVDDINFTDDIDSEGARDRSQLVANQTRVVAVVGEVRIDQSNRVFGIVSLNL